MSETFNQKQYNQATPIPAKFLLPDGTVVDELPTTGGGGGSGGTTNYNDLMNKPKINGNTLRDNLTSNDLGLASKTEVENKVKKEDGKGLISNAEKEQIIKNKTAIEVLNGDESVEGSVIKQIATALGKLNTLTKEIVNAVPSVSVAKDNVIYLLKAVSGNTYEMYSLVTLPDNSKAMASLGSTEIDLDGYLTEANAQRLYLALSTVKEEVLAKFNSVTEEGILYLTFNGSKVLTLSQLESLFYTKEEIDGMIGEAVVDDTKTSATTAYSSEKVQDFMDEISSDVGNISELSTTDKSSAVAAINEINDSLVDIENEVGNVYSTEETVCGKWIDGKPIYRKVLLCTANTVLSSDAGWKNVPGWSVTVPNVKQFVRINTSTLSYGGRIDYKIGSPIQFFCINSYFTVETGSHIAIEYTKTTD